MDNKICINSSSDEIEQRILLLMLKDVTDNPAD